MNVVALAIPAAPDEFRVLNGGVRLDWVAGDSMERRWAVGAVNWAGALSEVECRAATAVPAALRRSERFRGATANGNGVTSPLRDLESAPEPADVDEIIARRS